MHGLVFQYAAYRIAITMFSRSNMPHFALRKPCFCKLKTGILQCVDNQMVAQGEIFLPQRC